jgi:hypothetical protein
LDEQFMFARPGCSQADENSAKHLGQSRANCVPKELEDVENLRTADNRRLYTPR